MYYIGKRLGITLLTLLLVSLLTFACFHIIPGDAALLSLGTDATEEQVEAMRAELGLDKSLPIQYASWLGAFVTGSLGNSSRFRGESISAMVAERLPVTFHLAIISLIMVIIIAVPASFIGIKKENSFLDRLVNTFTAINISMPGFFLGVLLIWIFGLGFKLFTPGSYIDYRENYTGFLGCLFFPALAIALPNAAILVKFLRSSIFREFNSDYVRTARSKGLNRSQALFRHVVKNACLPAVTLLGMIIGEVFSGSIVIEQVFTIPGIGRLLIASITSRDYPMAQTLVVYIAFVVVLGNTLVDIAIRVIDPRIADARVREDAQ
ncbi:ABC transporter permease [Leadbettera azotonutricia]|uniref:ABC transporter, permease protein n=1 Tax=Leadbettera azotonutricia (strain ATCC BAA-888 / DSM 13862 / ZAS-9) TaxID=545695 RepID=F5Y8C2_LEAAZ|nr:ABC transporter permease [Leadbettera azotonutricia]AEF83446.1 ABC transporter, permease protein [Leadbettera azotonutricia ZAS-9]